jgi:hypothetical protein
LSHKEIRIQGLVSLPDMILPDELKSSLPTVEDIEAEMEGGLG